MKNKIASTTATHSSTSEEQYRVPGLEKGLAIIEYLSDKPNGVTLIQIKNDLKLSASSAYRILNTLVRLGYITFNDEGKIYIISKKMLTVGFKTLGEHDLLKEVLPRLRELRDIVRESVFFGVMGDERGIFIEQAQGLHPFKFVVSSGSSFEIHNSAGGKAILAWSAPHLQDYFIERCNFDSSTQYTISDRSKFRAELKQVHNDGFAVDNQEALRGVICVGAPILGYNGYALGAIWVSGPIDRMDKETQQGVITALLKTTNDISTQMGYTPQTT